MSIHVVMNQALKTTTLAAFGFVLPWTLAGKHVDETITVEGRKVTEGGMNGIVVEAVK